MPGNFLPLYLEHRKQYTMKSKPVEILDSEGNVIQTYASVSEAAQKLRVSDTTLRTHIKKYGHLYGKKCRFKRSS